MNIGNIISLTTKGYKPNEIKELADLAKEMPDVVKLAETQSSLDDVKALLELTTTTEPEPEKPAETPESEETPPAGDQSKEIEKLKEELKAAQARNAGTDNSGSVKTQEEAFESFMNKIIL